MTTSDHRRRPVLGRGRPGPAAPGRSVRRPGRGAGDADRIDADGLIALPGLVDLHTHLREPGREDAETVATGTRAAARGGFTAVLAMANTNPVTDTAEAAEHLAGSGPRDGVRPGRPGRRGEQGPGRGGTGRARADGPFPRPRPAVLRRRPLRRRRPADAPRAGVRPRLRRLSSPSTPRTRGSPGGTPAATRARSPAGSGCPAGRPRRSPPSSPATSSWPS